ncbi:MAG TPA: AAA family ATPase, partial [Candidatus Deferrimicrobium sp.]|nr:AAA family ATPase [Candidatus Deferrimicrobium sp.]
MKLDRLQIQGFGKFTDREFEFSPGLNLVYGQNEAGKSTLQNFLRGMLFGFKKQGVRRTYDEMLERYRPWLGTTYSGVMEYTLEGNPYRIERNFEPEEERVRILDGTTWQDLTPDFPMDKRKEVMFAQEHLGISQIIFDNTVCIRQLQNKSAQDLASEIQSKLVNLTSAGEEDVSIQQALLVLDGRLKELGVTERSGKTPLGKVTALVEQLEQDRQNTLQGYEDIRAAEINKEALVNELSELNQLLHGLTREVKIIQLEETRAKLEKVADYDNRIEETNRKLKQLGNIPEFPWWEKDNLLLIVERTNQTAKTCEGLESRLVEISEQLKYKRQTMERLGQFAHFTQTDALALEQGYTRLEETANLVRDLERKRQDITERRQSVEDMCKALAGCNQLGTEGEAEVYQLEEELAGLRLKSWSLELERLELSQANLVQRVKWKNNMAIIIAILGTFAGVGLAFAISWVFALVIIVGFGLSGWIWQGAGVDKRKLNDIRRRIKEAKVESVNFERRIAETSAQLETLLGTAGVVNSRELNEKMRQLALVLHSRQNVYMELVELENELIKLRQRLREEAKQLELNYLAPSQVLAQGQNITRDNVLEFCSGIASYLTLKAEEQSLIRQEKELLAQKENTIAEGNVFTEQCSRILALAGVATEQEFLSGCQSAKEATELQQTLEALVVARSEALGQARVEELQLGLEKLAAELGNYCSVHVYTQEALREEVDLLNRRISETKELIANLQGIIETRLTGAKNLTDIERELHLAWQEKEKILKKRKALEIARQTILEVSHTVQREFSPFLNQHIEQTISSLTAG